MSGSCSLVAVSWLLTAVASLEERGSRKESSEVLAHGLLAHGLSCSEAHGIFPDQGLNPALAGGFFTTEPPGRSFPSFLEGTASEPGDTG